MPAEANVSREELLIRKRYRGRLGQIRIYLGKLFRMFLHQKDWKVLPMAALVGGLVGIVIRSRMFLTMEGTLISSLAVACVCLWNGCFNSIQVICRERDVVKREHRSGMHISSYIASHMIYQALLCLLQTGITVYILASIGVHFPRHSVLWNDFMPEFFISLFLITYAADMMSLWISAFCHTTTAAMTVMPVVLIFQLVFSGGLMSLPERMQPIQNYVISNVGLKLVAAEADYNNLEMRTAWDTVAQMKNEEISGSFTVGLLADMLHEPDNPTLQKLRAIEILKGGTFLGTLTVGDIADQMTEDNPDAKELRETEITYDTTVGDVLEILGEDRVRDYVVEKSTHVAQDPDYTYDAAHIIAYWLDLMIFAAVFAFGATVTLEFIDKDKR